MLKPQITLNQFSALDLRVAKIIKAEPQENSAKLLRLTIDIGEEKPVTILSGISEWYDPATLINKSIVVIVNLEPKNIRGETSHGMLLAADVSGRPILLAPQEDVPAGTPIK